MKKVVFYVVFLLTLLSAVSASAQNFDLSQFSYSELQSIVTQATKEMMSRSEFQAVEVPLGVYQVGKEIPAGQWTVTKADKAWMSEVETGSTLKEDHNGIDMWGSGYNSSVLSDDNPSRTINLVDGYYVEISMGAVIFSTPTGPSFSFK